MVPKWVREEKETAYIQDNKTKITVPICALGGSIATAKTGLTEVCILKELIDKIKGKIVFFNRMDNEEIESFHVFGQVRTCGAGEAAKFELSGIVRPIVG
jgi:hypothetical protein